MWANTWTHIIICIHALKCLFSFFLREQQIGDKCKVLSVITLKNHQLFGQPESTHLHDSLRQYHIVGNLKVFLCIRDNSFCSLQMITMLQCCFVTFWIQSIHDHYVHHTVLSCVNISLKTLTKSFDSCWPKKNSLFKQCEDIKRIEKVKRTKC